MSELVANKYKLLQLIARIGNTELYRVENVILNKELALLRLIPGYTAADESRFFELARRLAKFSHPAALNLTDIGKDEAGNSFAILESAPEQLLSELLEDGRQMPLKTTIAIVTRVADVLQAASEKMLTHGNLSPDRILISLKDADVESVKVFGFSCPEAEIDRRFAAPELLAGAQPDARSDLFSLAAITYLILTGVVPFPDQQNADLPPTPLSAYRNDVPPEVEAILVQSLSANPDSRPSLVDFQETINKALLEPVSDAPRVNAASEKWKTVAIIVIGVAVLAAALIYATSGARKTDPAATAEPPPGSLPVQPINPATGIEEENLAKLPLSGTDSNTNSSVSSDQLPGGDGYNPWANGGVPPPGAPIPPPGQTITVPPGQSPFMQDSNCIMQPSGILLCPVPVTPSPTPKATPTPQPAGSPESSANSQTQPMPTPTQKSPAATPTPSVQPTGPRVSASPQSVKRPPANSSSPKPDQ